MANLKSIVLAMSLIFADISIFEQGDNIAFTGSTLLYLTGVGVLMAHLKFLPARFLKSDRNAGRVILVLLETVISFILLEVALRYIWKNLQELVFYNAETVIQHLSEGKTTQSFMCYFCCGRKDCPRFLSDLFLKALSFVFVMTTIMAF